jgi:hypothetical protein
MQKEKRTLKNGFKLVFNPSIENKLLVTFLKSV